MGALFGIPEWPFATLFVGGLITIIGTAAWRNTKRQISQLIGRRPNPSKTEFLVMMAPDVSQDASEFIWDAALPHLDYLKHSLTPHPDDLLVEDLPIDNEDWGMDWPRAWAERQGFHESNFHDWPNGWPVTIRNYGRWLDMGPQ